MKTEELNCDANNENNNGKCEDELLAAQIEIEKRDNELEIAHVEIIHQEEEIELQATELVAAYKELKIQNISKEKQAAELIIANKELTFQNDEKDERAKELFMANIELMFQNDDKEKRTIELNTSNAELIKIDKHLKEHIRGLEEIMFMISHKVRQPIANILGLANLFELEKDSSKEIKKLVIYNKESALALDQFTKELTILMSDLRKKAANN
ncbi:MAG: diguanylate cyclase [Bacteroidetes bacterium]|nr:diguanylate cyclase [Bacteroidota bacterium]